MSYAGLAIFDDGRLNGVIFLSNNADPNSNKDAPLKVGFAGGFLGLSLGGAPSVKYTYLSGGAQVNVADGAGPLILAYDDRTGDSVLQGGKLGDFLYGGSGNDVLNGGGGDDTLIGNLGTNIIRGGSGNNTASYVGYSGPNAPDTLGVQVFLDEREAYNRDGFGFHDTLIDIQNVVGTRFLDILVGDAGDNILEGHDGADVIRGGAGNDTSSYETSAFSVDVNLTTKVNDGGAAWGDILESIENVRGSDYADSLTGDAKANVLEGGAEADQLFGAGGSDTASYEYSLFGVTVNLTTGANTGGDAEGDILSDIENLRGSRYEDVLTGDATANVLEGGAKADQLFGAGGSDTASYEHSLLGVTVNLATGSYSGGDAQGDILTSIENLAGSQNADTLTGDAAANVLAGGAGNDRLFGGEGNDTLRGDAGSDALVGGDGDDRLVVIEAPTLVQGDAGNDKLFLQGAETFTFIDMNFKEVEAVYVRDSLTLDMSGVSTKVAITVQNAATTLATVTGTKGNDTITAGAGDTVLDGSTGSDKLSAGAGADTFTFKANFGRDNVYGFESGADHFDVSALVNSFNDINISGLNGGANTLITFEGAGSGNKIILHDVAASSLDASDFGFLLT
ncbi:calcium-binding protein [Methylobacterium bullatum]|uniref:Bifunctional hemolysin/adenylate cyclase n=1 Tax=Methylobacterium bullatum TaxID=570505 RepID=A0A679JFC1_9HYPH|nr:Bifunctional hemolysin/adenylate cyclase [Methylobacterium bullatum]